MPQLNPHPWLYSLLVVWAILLILLLPTTLKNKGSPHPNAPLPKEVLKNKKETWKWH